VSYVPAELTSQIAEWANRPVVINVSSYLNKGAVGGYIVQANPIGQQAGRLALRILGGENASDLPVVKVPSQLTFEWPALQRWKISESALPPGSSVQFRKLTLWEEHRAIVLVAGFGLIAQAAMIIWLLYEHQRRQAAEVAARRTATELAHMNRIATAGEMTASIAHEIRQPLGAIMTNGQAALRWLQRKVPDIEEAKTAVQGVIQDSARANDVITNIRAMFKKENTPHVVLDVNQLIEQVLVPTKQTISSKNVAVQLNLTDDLRRLVLGDPIQLQQVVLNLINNAIEAMSHPGHETRILRIRTQVDHSARMALVRVKDSGPRVDPKLVEKMFQPFFTTKSSGMGMGLSICKTIIEAHGGQLTATANNPHGMEFQIILPLHQRGANEQA
jgi:signal transduction histidine kinase